MRLRLSQIAAALGVEGPVPDLLISGYSTDSRTVQPGDLFFALRGPNFDGHQFIADVFRRGAAAAVVDRPTQNDGILLPVADTQAALEKLGAEARALWGGDVVGVTGSAGKTTTKDVIAHLLSTERLVGRTIGNFNNHIGVPLSILRLPQECTVAVLEIGMNHAGEIRALSQIARPRVAVVTNAGYAHIENFESVDGIALAKRELVEALPAGGVAVLNADDARVARFGDVHPGRTILFGIQADADVKAEDVEYSLEGARFRVGSVVFESPLPGRHGVLNVLAGIAVAGLYGIAPERLRDAVRSIQPPRMRGERFVHQGAIIWNDAYNSNPDAARAMLDVLRDTPARRHIAVLGEMLELGRWAEDLHRDIGRYAAQCGITVLVGIRGAARSLVAAAVEAGLAADAAFFFDEPAAAGDYLRQLVHAGDAVLFKGSRGTRVEIALERFLASSTTR